MLNYWCKGQNPIYTTLITQFRDWNRASDFLAWRTKDRWNRMHFRFKMGPNLPEIYRNILCIISLKQKHQMLPNAPCRNEKICPQPFPWCSTCVWGGGVPPVWHSQFGIHTTPSPSCAGCRQGWGGGTCGVYPGGPKLPHLGSSRHESTNPPKKRWVAVKWSLPDLTKSVCSL